MAESSRVYVALGDSTGVGVGAPDGRGYVVRLFERMVAQTPSLQLLNLCVSGATAQMAASGQLPRALAVRPAALATVFIGTNDAIWGSQAGFEQAVSHISSSLREREIPTVLCTLPNLAHAPLALSPQLSGKRAPLERKLMAFNERLSLLARRDGHALVDLFRVGLADAPHYFSADGFHPSSDGYEALAHELWQVVEPLLSGKGAAGVLASEDALRRRRPWLTK